MKSPVAGFHYTSYDRYLEVKHTGLLCKPIQLWKHGIMTPPEINGIWVWSVPLSKRIERAWGCMLMNKYNTDKIVKLSFVYSNDDVMKGNDGTNRFLTHTFTGYADNNETEQAHAFIVTKDIPAKMFVEVSSISLQHSHEL